MTVYDPAAAFPATHPARAMPGSLGPSPFQSHDLGHVALRPVHVGEVMESLAYEAEGQFRWDEALAVLEVWGARIEARPVQGGTGKDAATGQGIAEEAP